MLLNFLGSYGFQLLLRAKRLMHQPQLLLLLADGHAVATGQP